MVNTRLHVPQSNTTKDINLRSRLYPGRHYPTMKNTRPHQVDVPTRQSDTPMPGHRYPCPEVHLGDAGRQPWVHNCVVTVKEGPHKYRFMVFFKRHCHLRPNKCLEDLIHDYPRLRSDAVVMRLGKGKHEYLNMCERDTLLADWVMKRLSVMNFLLPGHKLPRDGDEIAFTKGRSTNRLLRN